MLEGESIATGFCVECMAVLLNSLAFDLAL